MSATVILVRRTLFPRLLTLICVTQPISYRRSPWRLPFYYAPMTLLHTRLTAAVNYAV